MTETKMQLTTTMTSRKNRPLCLVGNGAVEEGARSDPFVVEKEELW